MNIPYLWNTYIVHILDILIVCFLIYKFLLFIKDTRAMRIFLGLVFIFGVTFVVNKFIKLPMTSWILEKFWLAGVLLLAIVFQPELRIALSELYFPKVRNVSQNIIFIEEIVSAVKELSENLVGALIVISGKVGLKDFVKTGVFVNAEVSKELLISIFNPKGILHDGAVIISKNKVLAARCILPLSEDEIYKNLGTRHRAAIGISQITDATVIVVSEETGKISLVHNKKIDTKLSTEQLRDKLNKLMKNLVFKET